MNGSQFSVPEDPEQHLAPDLLVAIGGPTATGKSELALWLAEQCGGEIVNADSRQVYRGMDIGAAKPTAAQRAAAPHHLLDLIDPDAPFTLADYVREAHAAITSIQARGRLPLLVGGTGLYVRAVVQGYEVPAVPPDPDLRHALEQEAAAFGPEALVRRLHDLDPVSAARLDASNVRRLIRAIEVSTHLGVPFSSLQSQQPHYRCFVVVLTAAHATLYARADARLDAMLLAGFEAEVLRLLDMGYGLDLPSMSALGYREIGRYLRGESSREAAIEGTCRSTHSFIRRQLTWFRAEKGALFVSIEAPDWRQTVLGDIQRWLEGVTR